MLETYFDEYTTTGSTLDPTAATNLQQQLQQQQPLHQLALQQLALQQQQRHQQQQQQQQTQLLELYTNAIQQQQLQAQLEQQRQLLNSQTQLSPFPLGLAQAGAVTASSPPESGAFYGSPEADTLMLPTSPGILSPSEDGSMLSPTLLSTHSSAGAIASNNTDTNVKTERKATNNAKRQSMDDGIDAEAKTTSATSSKKTKKSPTASKATTPSSPKKPRTKKTSKNGSDQSDMEMSASSSMSVTSATPSPQTMPLQLPTSLATSVATSASDMTATSTAGLFQSMPLLSIMPTSTMAQPASPGMIPFGPPLWKMTPGMVLPPGMAGFDPSTFNGAMMPGLDVSVTTATAVTNAQQTPITAQSGPTIQPGQPQPLQQKIPITRLKPPQALSTPPPAPSNAQNAQPTKQQKKVAHNAIERRYRNNINDRINDLKNVVPALCNIKTKDEKDDDDEDEPQDADGVARATKLNKATILRKATEYIVVLQKREQATKAENTILRQLISTLPGGVDLLEQHHQELSTNREEGSQSSESSSEDSNTEPGTPPPASASSTGASRVLMAVFMGVTFFTPPQGKSGISQGLMEDGLGAARAMSSSSRVIGHGHSTDGAFGGSWGSLGLVGWDTWAAVRAVLFMGCLVTLVWGSYSRRGPFAQSRFPQMPKSASPTQVYATLSGVVPKVIPTSYFRLFFALSLELWRCLWIRLGFYPDLTDMVRPDIWARVVEAQMSGGAGSSVSRFMLLYTIVRTLDEYTNARRQPPARVSATAALAFYISIRRAAKPLATLVAQQFMESARYTAKIFGTGQDPWLEGMLKVEVGSSVWDRSILEIESVMYGRGEYPQAESVLYQTMAPTRVVAQIQSVSVLQEAYVAYMSRLNASAHTQDPSYQATGAKFNDVVRATLPGTRHHWYALVGRISELWLANDEHSAQLGDQMMAQVMTRHPYLRLATGAKDNLHSTLDHQAEDADSSFQLYDSVIVYSLLEYAYLRRGLTGPSVRCGEKAGGLLSKHRQAMGTGLSLDSVSSSGADAEEECNDRALRNVAWFAMNLVGFVQIKARIGLWRSVEVLNSVVANSTEGQDENESLSQTEILDHIRETLHPLTAHLRHQLGDESTTRLAQMQMTSNPARNKGRRPNVDFDPALRFLCEIGRVTYGAWEDGSDGSDSGCGSGGEEDESMRRSLYPKANITTKKSDAEMAWEMCQEL